MVLERRKVLTLCSRASTTQGWRSLVPSFPQTRWLPLWIIYNLPVYLIIANNFLKCYQTTLAADCRSNNGRIVANHARLNEGGGRHCAVQVSTKFNPWNVKSALTIIFEWGIYLFSYSVASAGPSSEEDSMEHMELETRGVEMDSSNPSYKR